jgi:hypothetical protein
MTMMVQLDDELVRQARAEAGRRGTTLDAPVEEVLRARLPSGLDGLSTERIALTTHDLGGPAAGVDFDDGRALRDLMKCHEC